MAVATKVTTEQAKAIAEALSNVVERRGSTLVVTAAWGIPTLTAINDARGIKNLATTEDKKLSDVVKAILGDATAITTPDGQVLFSTQTAQGSAQPDLPRLRTVLEGFGLDLDDFMVTPKPQSRLIPAKAVPVVPEPRKG